MRESNGDARSKNDAGRVWAIDFKPFYRVRQKELVHDLYPAWGNPDGGQLRARHKNGVSRVTNCSFTRTMIRLYPTLIGMDDLDVQEVRNLVGGQRKAAPSTSDSNPRTTKPSQKSDPQTSSSPSKRRLPLANPW
jgi:hypothetical protein